MEATSNVQETTKKWYESSNFWMAAVLVIGGLFVGFPESAARELVGQVFGLIGSAGLLRNWIKTAGKPSWERIVDVNNWNYLVTVLTGVISNLPAEIFDPIQKILENVFAQNWQGMLTGLFSLGTIIFKIWQGNKSTAGQLTT